LAIAFALSMFNNVLPSRGGEVSFVYMMRREHDVPVGTATAVLVMARVFDYLAVSALFVVAALTSLSSLAGWSLWIVLAVALVLLLLVAMLVAVPWLGQRGLGLLDRLLSHGHLKDRRLPRLLLRFAQEAVNAFTAIRSSRTYAHTALWSLLIWLGTFAWFWAFLRSTGIFAEAREMVLGATFAVLSKAIPFVTVGGLGTHEAGWTMGFVLVGFDKQTAIASGFAVNILTLLVSLVCGGLALLGLSLARRRRANQSAPAGPTQK
jgi:uncharacterized protein (TIRG00374 family)